MKAAPTAPWWTVLPGALLPALGFVLLALLAEHSGFDLWLADRIAHGSEGFPLARLWWTDKLLHGGLQWGVRLIAIGLLATAILRWRTSLLRPALYLLLCIAMTTGIAGLLKHTTNKDCPWDLARYGGDRPYVELGATPPAGKRPGHCFPGGHSSGAFAFFGLYFVAVRRRPALARKALAGVLFAGLVFAGTQWLRGAHFVSHDLWSAAIGWLVAALASPLIDGRRREPGSVRRGKGEEAPRVG